MKLFVCDVTTQRHQRWLLENMFTVHSNLVAPVQQNLFWKPGFLLLPFYSIVRVSISSICHALAYIWEEYPVNWTHCQVIRVPQNKYAHLSHYQVWTQLPPVVPSRALPWVAWQWKGRKSGGIGTCIALTGDQRTSVRTITSSGYGTTAHLIHDQCTCSL